MITEVRERANRSELEDSRKQINVTLVFPTQSDEKAEVEFMGRLKEVYLRNVGIESV